MMTSSRYELDLTRNTIRRLKSIQGKLYDAANQWGDIDEFIVQRLDEQGTAISEIITEIQARKA